MSLKLSLYDNVIRHNLFSMNSDVTIFNTILWTLFFKIKQNGNFNICSILWKCHHRRCLGRIEISTKNHWLLLIIKGFPNHENTTLIHVGKFDINKILEGARGRNNDNTSRVASEICHFFPRGSKNIVGTQRGMF